MRLRAVQFNSVRQSPALRILLGFGVGLSARKLTSFWLLLLLIPISIPALIQAQVPIKLAQDPDLSPDGKQFVFQWQGDIWIANTKGGSARRLTETGDNRSPKFSPDGKRIAFVSSRNLRSNQIYTMSIRGGEPNQLTFHTDGYGLMQWTADGNSLLVSASRDFDWRRGGRMFLIDANQRGGERLLFNAAGANGQLCPENQQLLFTREGVAWWRKGYTGSQASQLWKYDLVGQEFQLMNDHLGGVRSPLWAPDGKSYFYLSQKEGGFNLYRHHLADGSETKLTRFDDDGVVTPCISADGSTMIFRQLFDFYVLDLNSEEAPKQVRLTCRNDQARPNHRNVTLESATEATFSSDGLDVAFVAGGDLWIMDTVLREPQQITATPEMELSPVFSIDGDSLFFLSDADGQRDIWVATRKDRTKYWWLNDSFELKKLTDDSGVETDIKVSPDGEKIAFAKKGSGICLMNVDGSDASCLLQTWDSSEFDWSPDGKWLTWSASDEYFNRDVFVGPIDGSTPPINLSRHPRNDGRPTWSPDGKMIAFTGTRDNNETDIHIVVLQKADSESTSRDRKLEEALKKFEKAKRVKEDPKKESANQSAEPADPAKKDQPEEPKKETKAAAGKADEPVEKGASAETSDDKKPEEEEKKKAKPKLPEVKIDGDEIHARIVRVSIPGSSENGLMWSPDSKFLAFNATIEGKRGLYKVEPPHTLSPKLMMAQTVNNGVWIESGKQILTLSGGVPQSLSESGQATRYPFKALSAVDLPARYQAGFDLAWRAMRDGFYDGNLNNRNWNAIRRKYQKAAREAMDDSTFSVVVQMMLGELNGSHLGFSPSGGSERRRRGGASSQWDDSTAHFGLRFDPAFNGPGLRVHDVIYRSPAWQSRSHIAAGEIVLAINGTEVDSEMDLTPVLNARPDAEFALRVKNEAGEERTVMIRPISFGSARSLLYQHWARANQEKVKELTENQFGYVHIRGMNMASFWEFERDLFAVASGKDGLIIDVRDNGGGSTADHLLTVLTQPRHAITVPREGGPGYPHDRMVYATWQKPIVVLCNQNSFSNAEIFSHAIKTLKRGRLVGVPTAGGVISTGATSIMDLGTLRMPGRGWFLIDDGEDMELNGAVPDLVIWPKPADEAQGLDEQLAAAIKLLTEDVETWKSRPQPTLKKASERTRQ